MFMQRGSLSLCFCSINIKHSRTFPSVLNGQRQSFFPLSSLQGKSRGEIKINCICEAMCIRRCRVCGPKCALLLMMQTIQLYELYQFSRSCLNETSWCDDTFATQHF